jgi:DNA-binding NarL/FixJ family response regulator
MIEPMSEENIMRALIVDGEELFRLSLREVVAISGNFREILEAGSEHEFLAKTATHTDLSLVVLHPSSLHNEGEDWIKLVRRLYPTAAIVTISNQQPDASNRWLGTVTVPRSASVAVMVSTLRRAMRLPHDSRVAPQPARPQLTYAQQDEFSRFQESLGSSQSRVDLNRLSYRQKQILAMAADGLPNKEIAARLTIAEGTVKAHMHAIFKVLGVSNRTQAVIRYGASSQQAGNDIAPVNGGNAGGTNGHSESIHAF